MQPISEWLTVNAFPAHVLLDAALKGTVLMLLAMSAVFLLRRSSAAVRHRVWGLMFCGLLLLPLLSYALPGWRVHILPPKPTTVETSPTPVAVMETNPPPEAAVFEPTEPLTLFPDGPLIEAGDPRPIAFAPPVSLDDVALEAPESIGMAGVTSPAMSPELPQPALIGISLLAWLIGATLALLPLGWSIARNMLLWIRSVRVEDADWRALLEELRRSIRLRRRVDLLESKRPLVPMTWGLIRPVVLLPDQARGWTGPLRRFVLLHELAHVKRWDVGFQMLARVACSVYWFHPLVWYGMRRLRIERELACDDCVVIAGERPADYAEQLLEIARTCRPTGLAAAVAMAEGNKLEHRVRALLDRGRSHLPLSPRVAATLLVVAMTVVTGVAVVRPAAKEAALSNTTETVGDETSAGPGPQEAEAGAEAALNDAITLTATQDDSNTREDDSNTPDYDSITTEDDDDNTRMTPGNVDREVIDQVLTWGSNEWQGWRVGALLVNDLISDEPLTAGETIAIQYFLQNVSDKPQTIRSWRIDNTYPILQQGGRINLNTIHGRDVVEITAQPGEAVSPEGFAVLLESTGFPDGEYTIETDAAFSIPNEDGNGGSSPWRVGSVTLTVGEGGGYDAAAGTDDEGIVWGGDVAGLQVGMRLPEAQREWPVGSLLEGELYVKNVTDEPISFGWDKPVPLHQTQHVYAANGDFVQLNQVKFGGRQPRNPQPFTVEAGEQIRLGTALLKSQAERSDIQRNDPAQLIAESGEFKWQVSVLLTPESIPGLWSIIAGSSVSFEIVATDAVAAQDDSTSPDYDSITTEDDDGNTRMTPGNVDREIIDQVLVWGSNERYGWRVGALLVNDLVSDDPLTAGETIAVQYFLQNVSDEPQTIRSRRVDRTYPILGEGGRINLNTMHGGGVVEITAQPGEAVSPEGFAILLESTGLPDGEYSIRTTSAFSIPNENGNGGSSPWRVGSVTLTVGEGGDFDTASTTDDEGIVWGGAVAGLRVGMRLPEAQRQWPVGSLLEGELYVKNVTDDPITFEWSKPSPLDQSQVVYDANGDYVQLNSVFFTGGRASDPKPFTVPAGEQIRLGTALLKSQAKPSDIQGVSDPEQLIAGSGEFTWQVHVQLPRETIPELRIIAGSGPVPLEIVAADDGAP